MIKNSINITTKNNKKQIAIISFDDNKELFDDKAVVYYNTTHNQLFKLNPQKSTKTFHPDSIINTLSSFSEDLISKMINVAKNEVILNGEVYSNNKSNPKLIMQYRLKINEKHALKLIDEKNTDFFYNLVVQSQVNLDEFKAFPKIVSFALSALDKNDDEEEKSNNFVAIRNILPENLSMKDLLTNILNKKYDKKLTNQHEDYIPKTLPDNFDKLVYSIVKTISSHINRLFEKYVENTNLYTSFSENLDTPFLSIKDNELNTFSTKYYDYIKAPTTYKWEFTNKDDTAIINELFNKVPNITKFLQYFFNNAETNDNTEWLNFIKLLSWKYKYLYRQVHFAILMNGAGGTGKSFMVNEFLSRLFFGSNSHSLLGNVSGKVNTHFTSEYASKVITNFEEVDNLKEFSDTLKSITTNSRTKLEQKGKDAVSVLNKNLIFLSTNKSLKDLLLSEVKGRRYLVLNFTYQHSLIIKDILKIENVNKIFNEEIDTFRGIIANSDYWFNDSFIPNLNDFTNTNKVSFNKLGFSNSLFYKNMLEVLVDELDNKKSVYSDIDDSTNRKEEQRFCLSLPVSNLHLLINKIISHFEDNNPNCNDYFINKTLDVLKVKRTVLSTDNIVAFLDSINEKENFFKFDKNKKRYCFYDKNKEALKTKFSAIVDILENFTGK